MTAGRPKKPKNETKSVPVRALVTPVLKAALTRARGEESESAWVAQAIVERLARSRK